MLMLSACGGSGFPCLPEGDASPGHPAFAFAAPFPEYDAASAVIVQDGGIDLSGTARGYVTAVYTGGQGALFLVEREGVRRVGALAGDGQLRAFSLTLGNGTYRLAIMLPVGEHLYEPLVETTAEVALEREQAPYTVPNSMVWYQADSPVAELSQTVAENCACESSLALSAFSWTTGNLTYDAGLEEAALRDAQANGVHQPDLERIAHERTGLCGDYAAFFAALLRLNGVPCQVLHGSVEAPGTGAVYHAWNLAWLPDEDGDYGWVHFDPTLAYSQSAEVRAELGIPEREVTYGPPTASY